MKLQEQLRPAHALKKILPVLLVALAFINADAQKRTLKLDSIYAENLFTPNFSSLLMPKGFVEVIVSSSLLTATQVWATTKGNKFDLSERSTYDYTTAIVNVGVTQNGRFNAGLELHYDVGYVDSDPKSSMFNIFGNSSPGYVVKQSGLTAIGPRIKWRPIKSNLNFVYISTVQIPTLHNSSKEFILGYPRTQWGNTFLYSFAPSKKFAFFVQDDINLLFKKQTGTYNKYSESLSVYAYVLISKHIFPFVSIGYAESFSRKASGSGIQVNYKYLPAGVGVQYQYSLRFTINAYYNQYVWASNIGDYKTFNLGVRKVF